jgi:hypothetical protein
MYTYCPDKVIWGFKLAAIPPLACHPERLAKPVLLVCCCAKFADKPHLLPGLRQLQAADVEVIVPTANPKVSAACRLYEATRVYEGVWYPSDPPPMIWLVFALPNVC